MLMVQGSVVDGQKIHSMMQELIPIGVIICKLNVDGTGEVCSCWLGIKVVSFAGSNCDSY